MSNGSKSNNDISDLLEETRNEIQKLRFELDSHTNNYNKNNKNNNDINSIDLDIIKMRLKATERRLTRKLLSKKDKSNNKVSSSVLPLYRSLNKVLSSSQRKLPEKKRYVLGGRSHSTAEFYDTSSTQPLFAINNNSHHQSHAQSAKLRHRKSSRIRSPPQRSQHYYHHQNNSQYNHNNLSMTLNECLYHRPSEIHDPLSQYDPNIATSLIVARTDVPTRNPHLIVQNDNIMKKSVHKTSTTKALVPVSQLQLNDDMSVKKSLVISTNSKMNKETTKEYTAIPRTFDALMDTYSRHEIIIRKGQCLDETPEFISYRRSYQIIWPIISTLIIQLEQLCKRLSLNIATVDGHSLVQLAARIGNSSMNIPAHQLLSCITNINQFEVLRRLPGYRYIGENGRKLAIIKLQSIVRMFLCKRRYKNYIHQIFAARKIQIFVRNTWKRRETYKKARLYTKERLNKWEDRMYMDKNWWSKFIIRHRVIVHLPSIDWMNDEKLFYNKVVKDLNYQITRICDLKDSNIDIIYITPTPISNEVIQYYNSLLSLNGIKDMKDRVTFIEVEKCPFLPKHTSLATHLYYSTKTLIRIRQIIRGRPSIIIPSFTSIYDTLLAEFLNVALLSPSISILDNLRSRRAQRRLFSRFDLSGYGLLIRADSDIFAQIAMTIVEHPQISCWILKINNILNDNGLAVLDLGRTSSYERLQRAYKPLADAWTYDHNLSVATFKKEQIEYMINDLRKSAHKWLYTVSNEWEKEETKFLEEFMYHGGIIEAIPRKIVARPQVDFFIQPAGGSIEILSICEKVCYQHKTYGYVSRVSTEFSTLNAIIMKIGKYLQDYGVIGYVTINLIVRELSSRVFRIHCDEIQYGLSDVLICNKLFTLLNKGYLNTGANGDGKYYLLNQKKKNSSNINATRTFALIPYLHQPAITQFPLNIFFHLLRSEDISLDVKRKTGTILMLHTSASSGKLGILTIAHRTKRAVDELRRMIKFLLKNNKSKSAWNDVDYTLDAFRIFLKNTQ